METLDSMQEEMRTLRLRFEDAVEPHREALWTYCLRLTGSAWDAEDLLQDTMLKALAGLAKLWQAVDPRAYLFRIATNAWIDRYRHEGGVEWLGLPEELTSDEPDPELRVDAHDALLHLVDTLPAAQRVVFLLRETLGFRTRDVAQLLGTSEGAVKSTLHRARRGLANPALSAVKSLEGSRGTRMTEPAASEPWLQRYIEAFDARDADALVALLSEDAVTEIVGSAEELGREVSRHASIAEWVEEPAEQWARPGVLDGTPALFVFTPHPDGHALYSLLRLEAVGDRVVRQRNYFYSPELLHFAAVALGVPVVPHGHRWEPLQERDVD